MTSIKANTFYSGYQVCHRCARFVIARKQRSTCWQWNLIFRNCYAMEGCLRHQMWPSTIGDFSFDWVEFNWPSI